MTQTAPPELLDLQQRIVNIFWWGINVPAGLATWVGWGRDNIVGVAVALAARIDALRIFEVEVYVRDWLPLGFYPAFALLVGAVGVRFVRTGAFRFLNGGGPFAPHIGGPAALPAHVAGKIGLFVKGNDGTYAVTCAHVLNSAGKGTQVLSGDEVLGTLFWLSDITTPGEVHKVDVALVKLGVDTRNILPNGAPLPTDIADPIEKDVVDLVQGGESQIRAANASVSIIDDHGTDTKFSGVTIINLLLESGASGSLVIEKSSSKPVGIVMASSQRFDTDDGQSFPMASVICDLHPILNNLPAPQGPWSIR